MSESIITPGQTPSLNPAAPNTFRTRVAALDPFSSAPVSIDPGQPVTPTGGSSGPPNIIQARAPGGSAGLDAAANVLGLAVSAGEDPGSAAYFAGPGPLTLPLAAWNAVVGGSVGLTTGKVYYLSTTPGELTDTAPAVAGQYVTPVGFATSPTTMWVQIGAAVVVPG